MVGISMASMYGARLGQSGRILLSMMADAIGSGERPSLALRVAMVAQANKRMKGVHARLWKALDTVRHSGMAVAHQGNQRINVIDTDGEDNDDDVGTEREYEQELL
jgi:hypothetical protein